MGGHVCYHAPVNTRRFARRRFLAGAGVALTVGMGGAVALSRGQSSSSTSGRVVGGSPTIVPESTATRAPTPVPRGGIARVSASGRFNFDTFDGQLTGEPSVLEVLGRTHSRLVDWVDFPNPHLAPGLAERWEQPDDRKLVVHLDQRAAWQDGPGIASRTVTADDVAQHFRRQLALRGTRRPLAQRSGDYANWVRITPLDSATVAIETDVPDPFVLATLAGRFALVQSPQAVVHLTKGADKVWPQTVIGSGPFRFLGVRPDGSLSLTAARGGHREPNLDDIEVFEPGSPEDLLSFRRDDLVTRDRRDAAELRKESRLIETARYEDSPVISTVYTGSAPWNNTDLLRAISAALNRGWLAEQLFGGRADPCGPASPASGGFALDGQSLGRYAGYAADPETDASRARALWNSAGGAALGTVTIDFPSIFDPLYSASSLVVGRLNTVLGPQFRAAVETYTTISSKTAELRYGNGRAAFWFGWGPPLLEPDPSRALLETYFSGGPNADILGVQPSKVDVALVDLTGPVLPAVHLARVHDAQQAILDAGGLGVLNWVLQRSERFHWPYWHGAPTTPFWTQHWDAESYLDPAAESFKSRRG